jgi:hypothetical protein
LEIHAGYYSRTDYRSLSADQQRQVTALREAKKKGKKYGPGIKAADPASGVAVAVEKVKSPNESSAKADAAAVPNDSGAPSDDEDSVIAVEDSKPAAIPFGRAAYMKGPVVETPQKIAAVTVSEPSPRGPLKSWTKLVPTGKAWEACTQGEKDTAIEKWADYSHWRTHEKGGMLEYLIMYKFGLFQSRLMDNSEAVNRARTSDERERLFAESKNFKKQVGLILEKRRMALEASASPNSD